MFPDKLFRYALDRINGRFLSGWCFNRLRKSRPVTITIAADDTPIGSVITSEYRPDLKEEALHPTGLCGFDFSFPAEFDPKNHRNILLYFSSFKKPVITVSCREMELLRPEPDKRIFFMHIPKTAGTSFNAFARHCFAGDQYYPHIERLPADQRLQRISVGKYLAGHLPIHQVESLVDSESFDLYALLREPYHHLHSHLNYVRTVSENSELEKFYHYRHNETIHDFGRRLGRVNFDSDEEVKNLVGSLGGFELEFFDNIQTRYFLDYSPEKVTADDFAQARQNCARFRRIGLTEQYDRFRDEFCRDIALLPQPQTLQSNKSRNYRLFDLSRPSLREILLPLVETDLKLYDFIAGT